MDTAQLSGLAVFAGSVVVGLSSLTSALVTKRHEARAKRASDNKVGRQKLYSQFIEEASKLYVDALVCDDAKASAMVSVYALLSQMRMRSSARVVASAEAAIHTILSTYSQPNKSSPELQELILNNQFVDPLVAFSEVCRDELREVPPSTNAFLRLAQNVVV